MDEGRAEPEEGAERGWAVEGAGTWDASEDCSLGEVACAEEGGRELHRDQHNRAA